MSAVCDQCGWHLPYGIDQICVVCDENDPPEFWQDKAHRLEAERDAAYAQLREWLRSEDGGWCPCNQNRINHEGHKPDCPTGKALAQEEQR